MTVVWASETPDQVAIEIIHHDSAPVYNPKDSSNDEVIKTAMINSRFTLNNFMASDQTPEKIRICYAIMLINDRLRTIGVVRSFIAVHPDEKELVLKRDILTKRLIELK